MKNKKKGAINRAKKKAAKNVARKGKGVAYGKTVSTFNQIKQLHQQTRLVSGIDSKHSGTDHETTTFTDTPITKDITIA